MTSESNLLFASVFTQLYKQTHIFTTQWKYTLHCIDTSVKEEIASVPQSVGFSLLRARIVEMSTIYLN